MPYDQDYTENELYADIVEMMGGSPPCLYDGNPASITKQQLLIELNSLNDYHFGCGAYWMFAQIFPNQKKALCDLSNSKTKEDMLKILQDGDYCD